MNNELTKLSQATRMLAEAKTLDEVKAILNIAEAARVYAKAAKLGLEAYNHAAEVKVRAERKAGEMLARLNTHQQGGDRKSKSSVDFDYRDVLKEQKIPNATADRWQQLARLPEGKFEQYVEETRGENPITTNGLIRLANGKPHVAQNNGENEWYTPPEYIEAATAVMGTIDLDPASTIVGNRIVKAKVYFTAEDDGLSKPWLGTVWLNPPYAQPLIQEFSSKLLVELKEAHCTQACVLVNNATETEWFQFLLDYAGAVCFPGGRVRFLDANGEPGAPLQGQAILYFGLNISEFGYIFSRFGKVLYG